MKKETKVISILATAIFTISLLIMFIPAAISSDSFEDRDNEFSDYYQANKAIMYGFGSSSTSIDFEFLEGETKLDEDMFYFLKNSYEKFNYLDMLGSVNDSELGVNNIYDINQANVNEKVEINFELYSIINDSKRLFEISDGLFDITSGHIFDIMDDYINKVTDTYDISNYLTGFNVNFDDRLLIETIDDKYYATRIHEDTKVNLGGYLKGYFTEYVRDLAARSFSNDRQIFVNSASSSMAYIGNESKDIYVGSPREEQVCSTFAGLEGCPGKWTLGENWHISSSGDYVQLRMDGYRRVHHLVDPRDGGIQQRRGLVSIATNDYASYLDALSSIIFMADPADYDVILSQFDQKIDVVYLDVHTTQDDFDVNYIQSTDVEKFAISDRYLPVSSI